MKKLEIRMGILLMICALVYYYLTYSLPEKVVLYPRMVALLLLVLSTIFLIQTMITEDTGKASPFKGIYWRQLLFVVAISFTYIVIIQLLGFFLATTVYIIVGTVGLKIPFKNALITAIGVNVSLYTIFVFFLNVPLPKGILM